MRRLILTLVPLTALILAAASWGLEPEPIPEKWRHGDLAVYILSFPYPSYETKVVNETTGETVVVEKPAEVSKISIVMVVWNAGPGNPVIVSIDEEEHEITREGYYQLSFKEPPGLHHVAVYCEYKIFEEATVRVKPPPPLPLMITWEEFLRKLREAKEEVIRNLSIASAGGVVLGLWLKRRTRIFSYWAVLLLALPLIPAYYYIMDYYPLFGLSVAGILAYWLSPVFASWLGVLLVQEGSGAEAVEFRSIPTDEDGYAILGVSPRYWRRGFMLKKPVRLADEYPISFRIGGRLIETVVATELEETEDAINIYCSSALARALVDANLVEKLSAQLSKAMSELHLLKRAWPLVVTLQIREIERAFGPRLFQVRTWREATKEARKAAEELAGMLSQPEADLAEEREGGGSG
ncbi:hypothetical protein DRO58_02230 [Candidatus Bathyarchaeota archaeon]|nr:MAG: hypothetical protein DRO58_02230 [Candidatus Bathyarchaeota archaeon]